MLEKLGLDWSELYFAGQWARLLSLIEQLPSASRFRAEVSQNDELAWAMIQHYKGDLPEGEDIGPPLYEFDQTAQLLTLLNERIAELTSITIAVASGKAPHKVPHLPRPETAIVRAKRKWITNQRARVASVFGAKRE